ncbi:MAG: Pr6Pr family membrane protein [Clostridia bacterium]|nr:Pr6Pr family membrane protein [Clostridia bacterium]
MYIRNTYFKQIYRLLFLFLCEAGIVLQYAAVSQSGNAAMLSCYYTVLSNILCFVYFAVLVVAQRKKENPLVKGSVTMCIAVTGIVYHFLLDGMMEANAASVSPVLDAGNFLVHTVVPVMVVLDYFLFFPKGQYKSLHPIAWLVLPYLYFGFVLLRAEISDSLFSGFGGAKSRYPYPFLDVDLYGWDKVLLIVLGITVAFLALGYIAYVLDRLLGKNFHKSRKKRD